MILNIKEKHFIPDSVGNEIISQVLEMMSHLVLEKNPLNIIEEFKTLTKSTYYQKKYIESKPEYIDSKEIKVYQDHYYYIPILETLSSKIDENYYKMLIEEKSKTYNFIY